MEQVDAVDVLGHGAPHGPGRTAVHCATINAFRAGNQRPQCAAGYRVALGHQIVGVQTVSSHRLGIKRLANGVCYILGQVERFRDGPMTDDKTLIVPELR